MNQPAFRPQYIIFGISLALFIWGSALAVGAFLRGLDIRKPLIVLGCTIFFLGFWWTMLAVRRRAERIKFEEGGSRKDEG